MRWIDGLANAARAPPADKNADEVLVDGLRECDPNGMLDVAFPSRSCRNLPRLSCRLYLLLL